MKVKLIALCVGFSLLLSLGACKKKEEPASRAPVPSPGIMMPAGETKIVVPDFVKGKWDSIKVEILDKSTNKTEAVTINLNSEYIIPDTNVKIQAGDFLPDFRMDGLTITSASHELKNPAVHITVLEGENQIFQGWLYSKFPSIHPFQHEKYSLTLLDMEEK
jgi:hypothetical protein